MAPRKAPRKSLFGSQKWYFPDFPFRGSVGGRPVRNAGVSGNNFPKLLDSYSESVGFLGGCSAAMNHHLCFQISHSTGTQLHCWHL